MVKKILSDFFEIDYFPCILPKKSIPGAKNSLNCEIPLFSASFSFCPVSLFHTHDSMKRQSDTYTAGTEEQF